MTTHPTYPMIYQRTEKRPRPRGIALTAFLVLFVCGAFAVDMYPITGEDKKFLADIAVALQKEDSTWIAEHMVYPISVVVSNHAHIVNSKEEFTPILRRELTDSIRAKIAEAAKRPYFKNWQGVMIGDGILWFSQFEHEGDWTYAIFAIGGFAFQPKDSSPTEGNPLLGISNTVDAKTTFRIFCRRPDNNHWDYGSVYGYTNGVALLRTLETSKRWDGNSHAAAYGLLHAHTPSATITIEWSSAKKYRKTHSITLCYGNRLFWCGDSVYQISEVSYRVVDRLFPKNKDGYDGRTKALDLKSNSNVPN